MTAFIIKSGICMVLLFGLYWFLLRKEKLFTFNRYYLIFSILLSLIVPLLSFPVSLGYEKNPAGIGIIGNNLIETEPSPNPHVAAQPETVLPVASNSEKPVRAQSINAADPRKILPLIYLAGFLLMLIRFGRNIHVLGRMLRSSERIDHKWYQIALLDNPFNPFSFLHYVFVNKQEYLENRIASNVLTHELEHVKQSHSIDVIFFEIIHILFWFNPVIFFYKQAVKINHEYLADAAVINSNSDIKTYACELIGFISRRIAVPFTSGFSPSMIKLRLLMLNTTHDKKSKVNRVLTTMLLLVLVISALSMKPVYKDPQNRRLKNETAKNKDIVIQDIFFRDKEFNPLKAIVVINGKALGPRDTMTIDFGDIKTVDFHVNRREVRKYGKNAKNGVIEISTYKSNLESEPDSLYYKPLYTINDKAPSGMVSIPVSSLYSLSLWTYPLFPNQDLNKQWRLLEIMTRDYYKISGTVLKSDGEGLKDVHVSATDNPSQVITDSDGRFIIKDVNPGSMIELSADGYSPFSFKVTDMHFDNRLAITMSRINEPDPDMVITNAGNVVRDFSGTWKINKELTKLGFPGEYNRVCEIVQYDSDSIYIKIKVTSPDIPDKKEYSSEDMLIFNKIKAHESEDKIRKFLSSCVISPDGQSFSIISKSKSIIESFRNGFSQIVTYSMSDDGKQLFIGFKTKSERSSDAEVEQPRMVFDKVLQAL